MSDLKLYGRETEKALSSFGRGRLPSALIRAYAEVKLAVIRAQQETASMYSGRTFESLEKACLELIGGKHHNQFPLGLRQGGAGTSIHMNINEVLSALAGRTNPDEAAPDPLDQLARFQSTNDTFPTAVTIVLLRDLKTIETAVIRLQEALNRKEKEYEQIIICGRTETRSALPISLGQVFGAWSGAIQRDRWRLHKLQERVRYIPLGGTAIGTCFSAPRDYIFAAEKHLREITGLPLCRSQNLPDQVSNLDYLAELAEGYSLLAGNLFKISGDLMLYASSFIGELEHPRLQYGSSIMAFKNNPVLIEQIKGLSVLAESRASSIRRLAFEGQLQLNSFLPFIFDEFTALAEFCLQALDRLENRLLPALKPDPARIENNLVNSPALLNSLRDIVDYTKLKELDGIIRDRGIATITEAVSLLSSRTGIAEETLRGALDPYGTGREK